MTRLTRHRRPDGEEAKGGGMRTIAALAAAALALGGCSVSQDKASAEAGVVHFHQLLDAGRYRDIYAGAEPEFRRSGTEEEEIRVFQTVHDRLGAFRSSRQAGWRVNFANGGNVVSLTYNASFASAPASENFVFRIRNGGAQLMGYHVSSPALGAAPAPAKPGGDSASPPAAAIPSAGPPRPGGGK
jgi:hypothetical protein